MVTDTCISAGMTGAGRKWRAKVMSKMFADMGTAVSASAPELVLDDAPAGRLLRVVEAIAAKGPVTYEDLREMLGISKTATWRIVTTLRDAGWVRITQGGRQIVLDHRLDELFATALYSDPEFSPLFGIMANVAEDHQVHLDLFTQAVGLSPVLAETTRRVTQVLQVPVDGDENLTLALEGAMTPVQLTRHFSRILDSADPQVAMSIRSGEAGSRARHMPGFVWSLDRSTLTISLRGSMDTPAAIRIAPRNRKTDQTVYGKVFLTLRDQLANHVTSFGRDDRLPV